MARKKPAALRPIDVVSIRCDLCDAPAYDAQACEDADFVDDIVATEREFEPIGGIGHMCQTCSAELFGAIERGTKISVSVRLPRQPRKKKAV